MEKYIKTEWSINNIAASSRYMDKIESKLEELTNEVIDSWSQLKHLRNAYTTPEMIRAKKIKNFLNLFFTQ